MAGLRILLKISEGSTFLGCMLLIAACNPGNTSNTGVDSVKSSGEGDVKESSFSAHQKDLKMPATVNAKLNDQGEVSANISGIGVSIKVQGCNEDSPGIMLCNRSPAVEVSFPGAKSIALEPEVLYLDSNSTFYHGPLDDSYKKNRHSVILTDINGDGHEDLVLWSGKEGNYGGPSYSVYLFDAAQQRLVFNQSLSDITVMANGLFSVEGNLLTSTSGDGCCIHVFDTYELNKNEPVLIERVTEDTNDPANPKKKIERLQDGEMKEVSN
ncbi:FG-GAP repeat protein [Xanthomonas campestris pv. campestris]|nr:FG-GAP repeat protein [Xanthomonas campestris]MDM7618693.1 FG-GAP repeat protein [Xanthomonas campestris pv. campestris]MDM7639578.1 FG-GAP repeat protein [Xanthomonas campestris pv. campestris]MDM7667598.1 FG-GAP repeat protein [Xanthomonas campestris pv. campestris]MDM7734246.1 FG-GAP repeat protein [Xanthomonas campestris pv. campestris]MDM7743895.1 FG-GAP repeat protein [Xanthomonas campestris pv. campestris]